MTDARLVLRFLLDEGVPVSVGTELRAAGHVVVTWQESGLIKGAADAVVCTAAQESAAILVAMDGDMRRIAREHGVGKSRFRTLNLLQLECRESQAASRVRIALSLIEHEWAVGPLSTNARRLHVTVAKATIRTNR